MSIAIHVGFVAIATFYVVSVVSEQRKVAFTGGGSGDGTGGPAAETRHQVSVARQHATPVPSAHAQKLPGAKVVVFDDAGHMVFMEKASDVNALIKAHIAGS